MLESHSSSVVSYALGVKTNGHVLDLSQKVLSHDITGEVQVLTFNDEEGKDIFWHSSAHVLAQAVKRHYPKAQLTVGPVIKNGPGFFYYDIQLDEKITEDDFEKLEKEMHKICEEAHEVSRHVYERKAALDEFNQMGEHLKQKLLNLYQVKKNSLFTDRVNFRIFAGARMYHLRVHWVFSNLQPYQEPTGKETPPSLCCRDYMVLASPLKKSLESILKI